MSEQGLSKTGIATFSGTTARIAFVQDNFVQAGGGERVAEEIAKALPDADVFTSVVVEERLSPYMKTRSIYKTWMQKLPKMKKYYRHYFLLYPFAIKSIPLENYDLIVSSCYGYAKMLRKPEGAIHVCYCHTPTRWIWRYEDYAGRENFNGPTKFLLNRVIRLLKKIDLRAANNTDVFIANSSVVADRIFKYYGRKAEVIFPPIDCSRFSISKEIEDYYLIVSRLVPYKRVDLAIQACKMLGRKLIIIGDGPDRARLERMSGDETTFLGRAPDATVAECLSRCKALIFPGEEDFGLTPLEVNASGRPCIAFGHGGALDTVKEHVTGELFKEATAESLAQAILRSEEISWQPQALREHAEQFDRHHFAKQLVDLLSKTVHRARAGARESLSSAVKLSAGLS